MRGYVLQALFVCVFEYLCLLFTHIAAKARLTPNRSQDRYKTRPRGSIKSFCDLNDHKLEKIQSDEFQILLF